MNVSQVKEHTFIISALGRLRQENYKFEANLGYIPRQCLKETISKPELAT